MKTREGNKKTESWEGDRRTQCRSRGNRIIVSYDHLLEIPIDSGIDLSITIDKVRVFINKTLPTESLINQLLIKRVGLSISIDSR
jgi:hypothetical protein